MRTVGTVVRGIRCPIFKEGDDLCEQITKALLESSAHEGFTFRDNDVLGITESAVARTQGNYVTPNDIAKEVREKFPDGELGVVFPILSRNRFAAVLKGIADGAEKVHVLLSYPADEVGNHLMDPDALDDLNIETQQTVFEEEEYRRLFGKHTTHPFTGIDYIELYKDIIGAQKAVIHLGNDPRAILKYTKNVLIADVHARARTRKLLLKAGVDTLYGLDELCAKPVSEGGGYNEQYGLLGSNLAGDDLIKLFPRGCQELVERIQKRLFEATGCCIEVMVYGDGAFKDPVGKIWELADPVVSPGFTKGLIGTPAELKLKYLADERSRQGLNDEEVQKEIKMRIKQKNCNPPNEEDFLGTTPRQITDLLGSLCDLTSGSGDKGTPIVLIQGYFDNFAD